MDQSDGIPATSSVLDRNLGIAADRDGNVYIAEYASSRIRKISTNGIITTIAGGVCRLTSNNPCGGYIGDGGPATSAQLSGPARLAVDSDGTVYISDFNNNAVRVLRPIQ
jgi:DNA-binding beta-propeller fold protein YncE